MSRSGLIFLLNFTLCAAKSGNQDTLLAIFGPGSKELIFTGDAAEDKASLDGFVRAYQVMNRWRKLGDGSELLLVGPDNQAFPIPLKSAAGQWYFDAPAGREEIRARRIGRDEIVAIDVCGALADAQHQYFAQKHGGVKQYAQKFISDAGQQNGLYWESREGSPRSPVGPLVAFATEEGLTIKPVPRSPFTATSSAGWIVRAPTPKMARNSMSSTERRPLDSPILRTRQNTTIPACRRSSSIRTG